MIINDCFKTNNVILATTLVIGLSLVNHASAREGFFLVDLNRTVTDLNTLAG